MPKNFRLITMNFLGETPAKIILKIRIRHPHRMEVYDNGIFKLPNNAFKNQLGEMEFAIADDKFIPSIQNPNFHPGENYFDRDRQNLYISIDGNSVLDVKTSSTILVSLDAEMEMTPAEFYNLPNLAQTLAKFLDLEPSQVCVLLRNTF